MPTHAEKQLPKFRDVAPEFFKLSDRLNELRAKQVALAPRTAAAMSRANKSGVFAAAAIEYAPPPNPPTPKQVQFEKVVRDLVDDLGDQAPAERPKPQPRRNPDLAELAEIDLESSAIQEAIALLTDPPPGGGRSHYEAALIAGSRKYCDAVRGEYSRVARRYVDALIELGEAIHAHALFARALESQGVLWAGLKPVMMTSLAAPCLSWSELRRVVDWAIECGHAPPTIMPESWRKPSDALLRAAEKQSTSDFRAV
jgi:hypothetical protein